MFKEFASGSDHSAGASLRRDERRRRVAYLVASLVAAVASGALLVFDTGADEPVSVARAVVVVACVAVALAAATPRVPVAATERALVTFVFAMLFVFLLRWSADPIANSSTMLWTATGYPLAVLVHGKRKGLWWNLGLLTVFIVSAAMSPLVSGEQTPLVTVDFLGVHAATVALLYALGGRYETLVEARVAAASHEVAANTDPLTGVGNRRRLAAEVDEAAAEAVRGGRPLSVVSFDLDQFKRVNDRFGHEAGDDVLVEVVRRVQAVVRNGDALGRWGGEEFLVVLPDCDEANAVRVAEACREALAGCPFDCVGHVTGSFGVASLRGGEAPAEMLRRVDRCMYASKVAGRDRVTAGNCPEPSDAGSARDAGAEGGSGGPPEPSSPEAAPAR